jgi:hypothetical protein
MTELVLCLPTELKVKGSEFRNTGIFCVQINDLGRKIWNFDTLIMSLKGKEFIQHMFCMR